MQFPDDTIFNLISIHLLRLSHRLVPYSMLGDDDEDLNRAIQNSLLDFTTEGENVAAGTSYEGEAEDIAKALEESLKISTQQSSSTSTTRDIARPQLFCDACGTFESVGVTYWGQKICLQHFSDKTVICSACQRFKMMGMRYINLKDGRNICPDCYSVAILDAQKAEVVFNKVHEFYRELKIKVDRKVPFFLVDQIDMDQACASGGGTMVLKAAGLTLLKSEVIKSVERSSLRRETIEVIKKTTKVPRGHVTAMLVLYGYSALRTGQILAHEMMHAFLRRKGYHYHDRNVEEGICEVMGLMWVDWYDFKGDKSFSYTSEQIQFLEYMKTFIKYSTEGSLLEIYGDGLRDAKWAVEKFGLKYTLDFIENERRLPP